MLHYLSVLFLHSKRYTLLFGFHISHCLFSYEPYSSFTCMSSVMQDDLPLTTVIVHNLSALAARDLDKFLVSIGRQPSYVDLEVIFFKLCQYFIVYQFSYLFNITICRLIQLWARISLLILQILCHPECLLLKVLLGKPLKFPLTAMSLQKNLLKLMVGLCGHPPNPSLFETYISSFCAECISMFYFQLVTPYISNMVYMFIN